MELLCTSEWSFGRDTRLLTSFEEALSSAGLHVFDIVSDADLNRTLAAFGGAEDNVLDGLLALARLAMDRIDLSRHVSPIPRTGALDLCFFSPIRPDVGEGVVSASLKKIEDLAQTFGEEFAVPVFLHERSDRGRPESDIAALRKGGLGSLVGVELNPDFGPKIASGSKGVTIMGFREMRLAASIDIHTSDLALGKEIAQSARQLRSSGDERFIGVRAKAVPLPSFDQVRLLFEWTLPDLVDLDPVIEWTMAQCADLGLKIGAPRLMGAIRPVDLPGALRLGLHPRQVLAEVHDGL